MSPEWILEAFLLSKEDNRNIFFSNKTTSQLCSNQFLSLSLLSKDYFSIFYYDFTRGYAGYAFGEILALKAVLLRAMER